MNVGIKLIMASLVIFVLPLVHSAELQVSSLAKQNLGIVTQLVERAKFLPVLTARAQVMVPPNHEVLVSAAQSGVVAALLVMAGDHVEEGQVIARMSSSDYLIVQQKFVDAAIQRRLLDHQLTRDKALFDDGVISNRRLQDTKARADMARSAYRQHRQELLLSGLLESEIKSLEDHQTLYKDISLRAPVSGVVLDVDAQMGSRLEALAPLYRLADPSTLWLSIAVPVERLNDVRIGSRVEVAGDIPVIGRVISIGQTVEIKTQTVRVRAETTQHQNQIKTGQIVGVQVLRAAESEYWRIPVAALVHADGQALVFIETGAGYARVPVDVIADDQSYSVVSGDLQATSRLVVAGVSALKALGVEADEGVP